LRKFKKFAQSRWHSIPLGAMAIALVASLALTGIAFAVTGLISNIWESPTATITTRSLLDITSDLKSDFTKETGIEIPFSVTIHNPSAYPYPTITTHISIYRTDGTPIKEGDVTLYDTYDGIVPAGSWRDLTTLLSLKTETINLVDRTVLHIETNTHPLDAHGGTYDTDVTPLKVIFNTAGTYKAQAYSTNP
jgi:hypothetical protein